MNKIPIIVKLVFYFNIMIFNDGIKSIFVETINVRGAILGGWQKFFFIFFEFVLSLYLFFIVFNALLIHTDYKLPKVKLFQFLIFSPFFIMWMLVIFYENYDYEYYNKWINVILYIILFVFQYLFIKKIENYSEKVSNNKS